jgi:hypothetical protein
MDRFPTHYTITVPVNALVSTNGGWYVLCDKCDPPFLFRSETKDPKSLLMRARRHYGSQHNAVPLSLEPHSQARNTRRKVVNNKSSAKTSNNKASREKACKDKLGRLTGRGRYAQTRDGVNMMAGLRYLGLWGVSFEDISDAKNCAEHLGTFLDIFKVKDDILCVEKRQFIEAFNTSFMELVPVNSERLCGLGDRTKVVQWNRNVMSEHDMVKKHHGELMKVFNWCYTFMHEYEAGDQEEEEEGDQEEEEEEEEDQEEEEEEDQEEEEEEDQEDDSKRMDVDN